MRRRNKTGPRADRWSATASHAAVWRDPFDAAMTLWETFEAKHVAEKAKREFCRLDYHGSPERPSPAFDLAMAEADRMAARLTAKPEAAL
jgi:hypothetical protein